MRTGLASANWRGATLLEEVRSHGVANGFLYVLAVVDPMLGVCKVLQGHISAGIHALENSILRADEKGYRTNADWMRLNLAEVYLQIIAGTEKLAVATLLRNLPILLKVLATASSRISVLMKCVFENPHYDPAGYHIGRAEMILGLLYKVKKKRVPALEHLSEAKRILSQFGQTPILARVEAALAELGQ